MTLLAKLDKCLMRDSDGNASRIINCFSGLPAADVKDGQKGAVPGWNICPWPDEHYDAYKHQMEYAGAIWRELLKRARDSGVVIALELHPNFLAHNIETYCDLLESADDDGTTLGLNFDPSHFFWRNMDPILMIRHLNTILKTSPIKHCHGKDTSIDAQNTRIQGNHSVTQYSREAERVWRFVTIGEGWDFVNGAHDLNWWARFITELQLWGYDTVVSIEHEDSRKSFSEGLSKAVDVLDRAVNRERPGPMTWAERD